VIFTPPFRDPFNYNIDPMIVMGLDAVGFAIHQRFLEEDKPGFLGDLLARIFRQFGGGPTGSGSFIPIGAC